MDEWEKVLWSDESSFTLFPRCGQKYVWRRPGEEFMEECLAPTVKHGGGKIQIWGCFHASGVGNLAKIDGIMDKNVYYKILRYKVLREIRELEKKDKPSDIKEDVKTLDSIDSIPSLETTEQNKENKQTVAVVQGSSWIFQHDNDPKHTAKKNKNFLTNSGIKVLEWPSQSPDLNPIENIWCTMKEGLKKRHDRPSNLEELFEHVQQEWAKLDKELLRTLVRSMPNRIKAVIKNKGGATKY